MIEKNKRKDRRNLIDLTGKKFTRLLVIKVAPQTKDEIYWICECDCGKIKSINGASLRHNRTKSCGCLQIDLLKIGEQMGISYKAAYSRWRRGTL